MKKITFLFPIAAIFISIVSIHTFAGEDVENDKPSWQRDPLVLEVVLQKQYIDGSMEQETKEQTVWSLEDFWAGYADWTVMEQEEGRVVFQKKINDLSPTVKQNGYFGLDENNVLSIFDGKPENDNVIKAFYQINVEKLESYRMDQLEKGIKINKKDTFDNVMETFKEFASSEPVND
ncbi:BofC C-terminal domain-containing protein [Salirhabdus sp. Marseille-P4669]|uniref:BofC C-terminal domain-containing protein n=1 Tax=Salirhabdus sp. Marseille-P4669 TaxID=2042310 RepID=UPI000C7DF48A|nr:BofC C-terminal domain-containing protein [Salirhabdus sp. Marseille-P4669]